MYKFILGFIMVFTMAITVSCKGGKGNNGSNGNNGNSGNNGNGVTPAPTPSNNISVTSVVGLIGPNVCRTVSNTANLNNRLVISVNEVDYIGTEVASGSQSCVDLSALTEGSHSVEYAGVDSNNETSTILTSNISLDKTPPTITYPTLGVSNTAFVGSILGFVADDPAGLAVGPWLCGPMIEGINPSCDHNICDSVGNCSSVSLAITGSEFVTKRITVIDGNVNEGADLLTDSYVTFGSDLYFVGYKTSTSIRKMYKWDGTTLSHPFQSMGATDSDFNNGYKIKKVGSDLYMTIRTSAGVMKIHKWDGTNLVKIGDIKGVSTPEVVYEMVEFQGNLYFIAENSSNFRKVYKYDGTNIIQVSDTNVGDNDNANGLTVSGANLYFSSVVSMSNYKLHKYDGTTLTQAVDNRPGNDDRPMYLTDIDGILYLSLMTSTGQKAFKYDGSNLTQISDTYPGSADNPYGFTKSGSSVYFVANNNQSRRKLYKESGSTGIRISYINSETTNDITDNTKFKALHYNKPLASGDSDNYLLFYATASTTAGSTEQIRILNTTTDTMQTSIVVPGVANYTPAEITQSNGRIFFTANKPGALRKLFSWDGTNTKQVVDFNTTNSDFTATTSLFSHNNKMFYRASVGMYSRFHETESLAP